MCCTLASAQQTPPASTTATAAPSITGAWDTLIKDAIPQAPVDPVLKQPQTPFQKGAADDFLNHFFLDLKTNYEHSDVNFTGLPTVTGVINAPFNGSFADGIPYLPAFQPDANRMYSFLDLGTRGWGSDRINTSFGVRYRQDLSAVDPASPNANILESYNGGKLIELAEATIEINSKPSDGMWAGTSLLLGRQTVYGAESASFDGGQFNLNKGALSLTLFGGRRFTYFSDPLQRAMGGGNLFYRFSPNTTVGYETVFYIRGTHKVNIRQRINDSWMLSGAFKAYGGSAADVQVQALYHSRNGKTSANFSFFQKLSDNDYFFDFTDAATDLSAHNPYLRLNLGPLKPYGLYSADARHSFGDRFNLGASVAIQRLNDNNDQESFLTSFQDFRINAQVIPLRRVALDFGYHQHDSDRLPALQDNLLFDQISHSGETSIKDFTAQVRRSFGEGRMNLSGGIWYRRIDEQDRTLTTTGNHQSGWLAGAWYKLDDHTRVTIDYSLDNDYFLFRPAISNAQILRVGLNWKL